MRIITTLIFLVICFCSNAQHLPGGVASPYLWSIYAISLTLPTQGAWFAAFESDDMRKSYKLIRK